MKSTVAALLFASLLATAARAQLAGPGLNWLGTVSGGAGSFAPSCTVLPINASRGESVTLKVWGDLQSPFGLFAAGSSAPCTPFPGIGAGLLLGQPVVTVTFGVLTQFSPCLSCPPAFQVMTFSIPATVPPNTMVVFQAVGYGNRNLSFTVGIAATVP
jgi:hypothetical protein